MLQPLNWTEFSIWGLLGFGATIPAKGMMCLTLRDVGGKSIISFARFVRKGLAVRFETLDGGQYSPWQVNGWMDAKPVISFIKGKGATQEMPA